MSKNKKSIDFLDYKYKQALNFEDSKEFDKAELIYNEILEVKPDDFNILLSRAVARLVQDKTASGLGDLSSAYKLADTEGKIRAALIYEEIGSSSQAYIYFQEIIIEEPDNYKANVNLARLHLYHNKKEEAKTILNKLIEKEPDSAEAYIQLANVYLTEQQIDQALDMFEKSLKVSPDNVYVLYTLTLASLEKNDLETAKKYLNHALTIEPQNQTLLDLQTDLEENP